MINVWFSVFSQMTKLFAETSCKFRRILENELLANFQRLLLFKLHHIMSQCVIGVERMTNESTDESKCKCQIIPQPSPTLDCLETHLRNELH